MVHSPHYLMGGVSKNLGAMRLKGVKEYDKFHTGNWDLVILNSMYRPLVSYSDSKLRFSFLGIGFNNKQKKWGEMSNQLIIQEGSVYKVKYSPTHFLLLCTSSNKFLKEKNNQ